MFEKGRWYEDKYSKPSANAKLLKIIPMPNYVRVCLLRKNRLIFLVRFKTCILQKFRSEFEVHRVIMIPRPAPYETMFLEDVYKFTRNFIGISHLFVFIVSFAIPLPIIGFINAYIKSYTIGMCTHAFCSSHGTPIECARTFKVRF